MCFSDTGKSCYITDTIMKSISCISSSMRAACQHTKTCLPVNPNRALIRSSPVGKCTNVTFTNKTVVVQQPCVTGVRAFHCTHVNAAAVQPVSAAPLPTPIYVPGKREDDQSVTQLGRCLIPKKYERSATHLSPYSPYTKPQSNTAVIQSLFEGEVIQELCTRLAHFPINGRVEGLATLLGACVEFGVEAHNPLVSRLINQCLELLSSTGIKVAQLCHLGELAYALEGCQSVMVTSVLDSIGAAMEEDFVSPTEAVRVYSLLALCYQPANQKQTLMLSTLHRHTQRLVHRLKARQVCDILQSLLKLQQTQVRNLLSQVTFH